MMRGLLAVCLVLPLALFAEVPASGVPSGCDGSVMSEGYWRVWNADEQTKIDADIEKNRKADGAFFIPATTGTEVTVEQLDHDFRFGAHIFNFNQLGKAEYNDAYKASYGRNGVFNQATVAFYWDCYEPEAGKLRAHGEYVDSESFWNSLTQEAAEKHPFWRRPAPGPIVEFLKARDVALHGHVLVWGSARPFWLYDRYCPESEKRRFDVLGVPRHSAPEQVKTDEWIGGYETHWRHEWQKVHARTSERELAALAPRYTTNLRRLFAKRVRDVAAEFGDAFDSWDVVNESAGDWERYRDSNTGLPLWKSDYGIMPGDYPLKALQDAKAAFPDEAKLCINDYRMKPVYLEQIRDLDRRNVKIDVVGCQMHIFDTNLCMRLAQGETNVNWVGSPRAISDTLDMISCANRPIHVSEVTIAAPGVDARAWQIQAILLRNIYRKWFSHTALMGITWWNTVDGGGVAGEPRVSGLFTREMRKKPAYEALDELVNREWKTHCKVEVEGGGGERGGTVSFRGFRGKYRLSWMCPACGIRHSREIWLTGDGVKETESSFVSPCQLAGVPVRSFTVDGKPVALAAGETTLELARIYPESVVKGKEGFRWANVAVTLVAPKDGIYRLGRVNDYYGRLVVNEEDCGPADGSWEPSMPQTFEVKLKSGANRLVLRTRAGTSGSWRVGLFVPRNSSVTVKEEK